MDNRRQLLPSSTIELPRNVNRDAGFGEADYRERLPGFISADFSCSDMPHCSAKRRACCNIRSYACNRPCPKPCVSRLDMLSLCIGVAENDQCNDCCGDDPQNHMAGAGNGYQKRTSTGIFGNGAPTACEQLACVGSCCMGSNDPCAYRCIAGDIHQVIPNVIGSTMTSLRHCELNELWSMCK